MTARARELRAVGWTLISLCTLAGAAIGQVDCSNPDNLCTGDPCTISEVTVLSPCAANFGSRTLIIGGQITVPDGGVLDLTAGTIEVRGRISGVNPNASQLALTASGNLIVAQRIDASGRLTRGEVALTAGGDIDLRAGVIASDLPDPTPGEGGKVTIEAGGMLTSSRARGTVRTKGTGTTPGGDIVLRGTSGVDLNSRVEAPGRTGGTIVIESSGGDIVTGRPLRASGKVVGGSIALTAASDVTLNGRVEADGFGGTISIDADSVTARSFVRARDGDGAITVDASGPVTLDGKLDVRGSPGGQIAITAGTAAVSINRLFAEGYPGGSVTVSAQGPVTVDGAIDVDGDPYGGTVTLNTGDLLLNDKVHAKGENGGNGGTVVITSDWWAVVNDRIVASSKGGGGGCIKIASTFGKVEVHDKLDAEGGTGGRVVLEAPASVASVTMDDGEIDVDGQSVGGSIAMSGSTVSMAGKFRARGLTGGTIEGVASGDLTAEGDFDARSGGCIGLSAGGTLNTTWGSFTPAYVTSCPPPSSACPF